LFYFVLLFDYFIPFQIQARAVVEGNELIRAYSPFTKQNNYGVLELLIKIEKKSLGKKKIKKHTKFILKMMKK